MISTGQATTLLRALGWSARTSGEFRQDLEAFQRGSNLGGPLEPDGILGEQSSAALLYAEKRRLAGAGTASEHFSFAEFACPCRGRSPSCRSILVLRPLLWRLEHLRTAHYPHGLRIVSGYRCPDHNGEVQGAAGDSRHMYGEASDVEPLASHGDVAGMRLFAGIGYQHSTGLVRHVDVRDNPYTRNPTGGTPEHPTTWQYAP